MSHLFGKNVLITGGATGIGKEMGKIALMKGVANLIIWDIDEVKLKETESEFKTQYSNVFSIVVDVSDVQQIISAAEKTKQLVGSIDILINNAGILIGKYFHEHSHTDIHNGMVINANAYMHIASEFLSEMINQNSGHICNVASAAGMIGNPRMAIYCASKSAVIGWSDSLRLEMKKLGKNIHVTVVTPNYINTGMIPGVKSLIPIIEKEDAAQKIIKGIERNKIYIRFPGIIYILPFLKGILPVHCFDFVIGKIFGVYKTMNTYSGKQNKFK
jgi:all-trans-retinol dehydrogenase (NAD+)